MTFAGTFCGGEVIQSNVQVVAVGSNQGITAEELVGIVFIELGREIFCEDIRTVAETDCFGAGIGNGGVKIADERGNFGEELSSAGYDFFAGEDKFLRKGVQKAAIGLLGLF